MSHSYETTFQIGGKQVLLYAEFKMTARGCPAHMGSMSYAGHPAEPAEFEFQTVELNATESQHSTNIENYFPAPEWIWKILAEDSEVYADLCEISGSGEDAYVD